MAGALITFEGVDGSGKTTQLERLAAHLVSQGLSIVTTREPGGTPLGRELRKALLDGDHDSVDPLAELLLYAADRAQHVKRLIEPSLAAGKVVLCDRYTDATVAYQGAGRGFSRELITRINDLATGGLTPTLTLLYDLEVGQALARTRRREGLNEASRPPDRLDREPEIFHERVRQCYLDLARENSARFRVIDAAVPVDALFEETLRHAMAAVDMLH